MLKDVDLLVNDHSGAYFNFLSKEKPTIFAAFDLEACKNSSSEMDFNYEDSVWWPIVLNRKESLHTLSNILTDKNLMSLVKEKNSLFNKNHDSNNSKRTFEAINSL